MSSSPGRQAFVALLAASIVGLAAPARAQLVNPVTHQLWTFGTNSVVRTDLATFSQQSVPVAASPTLLRIDPIRNRVYVQHANGAITLVDGRTLAATPVAGAVASSPIALALDPERNRIYATVAGAVRVIDGSDLSVTSVAMPGGAFPSKLAVDPVLGRAYTGSTAWPPEAFNPIALVHQLAPDPAAFVDSLELTMNSDVLPHWGIAVDPTTGRTFSQLYSAMFGGSSLFARADWPTRDVLVQGGGGVDLVIDPPGGRMWAAFPGDGSFSCGSTRGFSLATLTPLPGTRQTVCVNGMTVHPATTRAYVSGYVDANYQDLVLHALDPVAPAIGSTLFGPFTGGGLLGLDVATNVVYVNVNGSIVAIDEPVSAPIPIDVAITPGAPAPDGSVPVSFAATTGFPLPIRHIYYQVDAIDGEWTAATPAGASGSATLTGLAPGTHVVHAFATDGQEATIASGPGQAVVVGPTASVEISVPAPAACANGVDDDGDGATDYPADAGCRAAHAVIENPQCDNGIDDDGDLATDHPADTRCRGRWDDDEASDPASCGLGAELALLGVGGWLRARRASRG